MAIPAAAGYPQYSGNLTYPNYSTRLLYLAHCASIYSDISNTEWSGDIREEGDQVTFRRQPDVTTHSDYDKGGNLIADTMATELVTLQINRREYFNYAVDRIDQYQIQGWSALQASLFERGAYRIGNAIDTNLLAEMPLDVDINNKGVNAGIISHAYNLGATGNPVPLSSNSIVQTLADLRATLVEQCFWNDGDEPYIVMPEIAETLFLNSDLKNVYTTGEPKSPILNGRLPNKIMGFNVYISNYLSRVYDPGPGKFCYNILAGVKSATAFAQQLNVTEVVQRQDSWGVFLRGLSVYGFKVLQPKAIANLYAKFN